MALLRCFEGHRRTGRKGTVHLILQNSCIGKIQAFIHTQSDHGVADENFMPQHVAKFFRTPKQDLLSHNLGGHFCIIDVLSKIRL